MIGSFIFSIIAGSIYLQYQPIFTLDDLSYLSIIFFISGVSQIGDLIISYFKRLAKVKNTGKILPGHGGLLDRVDGIIFAIPTSYLLFNYLI